MFLFFFEAEDGIRDLVRSRGLGDVYKRQVLFGVAVTVIALSQRPLWFGALLVAIAVPYMTIGLSLIHI